MFPSWDSNHLYNDDIISTNSITYHNLNTFISYLDPIAYFKVHESFSISSTTSALSLPSISVVADNLLRLQGCSPGKRFLVAYNDDGPPIVIDSGASYSVTPLASDFIEGTFVDKSSTVAQLSSTVIVAGHGQAHWRFPSSDGGSPHALLPINTDFTIRLFSPQAYINQTKQGTSILNISGCNLTLLGDRLHYTPFHAKNNIPLLHHVSIEGDLFDLSHTSYF